MDNSGNRNNDEISSLFSGLKFEFNSELFIIENENEFSNYIKKIDDCSINLERKYNIKYPGNDKFNESINSNIKNTFSHISGKNDYNNVFILNNALEEDLEFSFEIKLGHGFWENINYSNSYNNLIIGLLQLNKDNIKEISDYITINDNKNKR